MVYDDLFYQKLRSKCLNLYGLNNGLKCQFMKASYTHTSFTILFLLKNLHGIVLIWKQPVIKMILFNFSSSFSETLIFILQYMYLPKPTCASKHATICRHGGREHRKRIEDPLGSKGSALPLVFLLELLE